MTRKKSGPSFRAPVVFTVIMWRKFPMTMPPIGADAIVIVQPFDGEPDIRVDRFLAPDESSPGSPHWRASAWHEVTHWAPRPLRLPRRGE